MAGELEGGMWGTGEVPSKSNGVVLFLALAAILYALHKA
jgi:hypothetical protein